MVSLEFFPLNPAVFHSMCATYLRSSYAVIPTRIPAVILHFAGQIMIFWIACRLR